LEVLSIAHVQGLNVPERCDGDLGIGCAEEFTAFFQETENYALMPGVGIVDWPQLELGVKATKIGSAASAKAAANYPTTVIDRLNSVALIPPACCACPLSANDGAHRPAWGPPCGR